MERSNVGNISAFICDNVMGLSTIDNMVRSLSTTYSQTLQMLFIVLGIFAVSLAIVVFCGVRMLRIWSDWKKEGSLNKEQVQPLEAFDDFKYKSRNDLPEAPQAPKIADRINKITALYKEYNKAVAQHAMRKDQDPDGLMDASIMDASNDNYEYPKDDVRIRRNENNPFVRVTW